MLFNSLEFILFLPAVVILYYTLPHRFRWILLLCASYYFYMCWKLEYIFLIIASTLVDYFAGIQMGKTSEKSKRKIFLIISLTANLGLLFAFKYFNFFSDSLKTIINCFNIFYDVPSFEVLLPVGISFYTFQTLSYSIDVYRGERAPEKHLGLFALYVSFFPQLVAGPIERSTSLLPQFHKNHTFDYKEVTDGLKLILWGFFKKLVIADRLAVYINPVFNNPTDHSGASIILASYLFLFQIYCDFSAYSDIAIGSAQTMGYKLRQNFNRPFFSQTIAEVWTRWHMSLTSWLKDYLADPLRKTRLFQGRRNTIIMITMLLVGLWHGANWTFVVWGATYGFYIVFANWTKDIRQKTTDLLYLGRFPAIDYAWKLFVVFNLRAITGLLFRANSFSDISIMYKNIFTNGALQFGDILIKEVNSYEMTATFVAIFVMLSTEAMQEYKQVKENKGLRETFSEFPVFFRWATYYFFIFSILLFGQLNLTEFVYFQF